MAFGLLYTVASYCMFHSHNRTITKLFLLNNNSLSIDHYCNRPPFSKAFKKYLTKKYPKVRVYEFCFLTVHLIQFEIYYCCSSRDKLDCTFFFNSV